MSHSTVVVRAHSSHTHSELLQFYEKALAAAIGNAAATALPQHAVVGSNVAASKSEQPPLWTTRSNTDDEPPPPQQQQLLQPEQPKLRVGVLNRAGSREWVQGEAFASLVRRMATELVHGAIDAAAVNHTTFDGLSPLEQALWVMDKDIIVAPHGAQNANFLFARPCTCILELHVRHYWEPNWFLGAASSVGALPYFWYDGGARGVRADGAMHRLRGQGARDEARAVKLELEPDVVASALPEFVREHLACLWRREVHRRRRRERRKRTERSRRRRSK